MKKFVFTVGIDSISCLDDNMHIELFLSNDEIQQIVKHAGKMIWNGEDNEEWLYIEECLPETYLRLSKEVEIVGCEKWGDGALLKNGAHYLYFIPEEIQDLIMQTESYKRIEKRRKDIRHQYEADSKRDGRVLKDYCKDNSLKLEFIGDRGGSQANYSYTLICEKFSVSYAKFYQLEKTYVEIKLEKGTEKYQSAFRVWKNRYLEENHTDCKNICDRLHICDMGDMDGVQIFMELVNML